MFDACCSLFGGWCLGVCRLYFDGLYFAPYLFCVLRSMICVICLCVGVFLCSLLYVILFVCCYVLSGLLMFVASCVLLVFACVVCRVLVVFWCSWLSLVC